MSNNSKLIGKAADELTRLTAHGVLGFYTHFEITEIFCYRPNGPPINVFSIAVAEERLSEGSQSPQYIGGRFALKSLKGWTFSIQRSLQLVDEMPKILRVYGNGGDWAPLGKPLQVGALCPEPTQFVPPDATSPVPLNNVLKNNFWSGSHLIELADVRKLQMQMFFEEPRRLQELSENIQKHIPVRLASLSDRLGNVIIQLPVTTIIGSFAKNRETEAAIVTVHWHPKSAHRSLRATCEMHSDNMITSYASADVSEGENALPTTAGDGMQRGVIWDPTNFVVLAGTGLTGFIETIAWDMHVAHPEPRVFVRTSSADVPSQVRIPVGNLIQNRVGTARKDVTGLWKRQRIYRQEAAQSAAQRIFVQYMPAAGNQAEEHERALQDIRHLVRQYGKTGAWLWDPYLSAEDVLDTLFYCPYMGIELRALTDGQEIPHASPGCETQSEQPSFAERQRATFAAANSNVLGLRLEYRVRAGQKGWSFHDRFLIFPHLENGALAWSLGTSVNSLGKKHHILQRVTDGQMIADAFENLWDQLDQSEHMIWKAP